jgi:single-stranded-DNA-specific exonuclease
MDVADDVIELFLTRNTTRARELAEKLDQLNQDRRTTEAEALDAIERQLEPFRTVDGKFPAECIILDDPTWHRGVLGILASRVVDRTGRPALILTHEDGQAHGSGRSVAGFHLLDALTAVDTSAGEKIFTRFGGHAHAVGFSLPTEHLELLRRRMRDFTATALTLDLLCPERSCDAEVTLAEITPGFYKWLLQCGPFGNAHSEPVFLTRHVTLVAPIRIIKEKHVCLEVTQDEGQTRWNALGWSRAGHAQDWPARCRESGLQQGSCIDIIYRISENKHAQFGGLQLELVDMQTA